MRDEVVGYSDELPIVEGTPQGAMAVCGGRLVDRVVERWADGRWNGWECVREGRELGEDL